jgi:hypothetical protein
VVGIDFNETLCAVRDFVSLVKRLYNAGDSWTGKAEKDSFLKRPKGTTYNPTGFKNRNRGLSRSGTAED